MARYSIPSYEDIEAATHGDAEAIDRILKRYEPYMLKFTQDEQVKGTMEIDLIRKMLAFELTVKQK